MVRRYFDLPSLTGLQAFEAAARLSSLKLATAELNVAGFAKSRTAITVSPGHAFQ